MEKLRLWLERAGYVTLVLSVVALWLIFRTDYFDVWFGDPEWEQRQAERSGGHWPPRYPDYTWNSHGFPDD